MLYTEQHPAYDAGNRWHLPRELPLSWGAFIDAKTAALAMLKRIEEGLRTLADDEVSRRVREWLAEDGVVLSEVAEAVASKLKERTQ